MEHHKSSEPHVHQDAHGVLEDEMLRVVVCDPAALADVHEHTDDGGQQQEDAQLSELGLVLPGSVLEHVRFPDLSPERFRRFLVHVEHDIA